MAKHENMHSEINAFKPLQDGRKPQIVQHKNHCNF